MSTSYKIVRSKKLNTVILWILAIAIFASLIIYPIIQIVFLATTK